jgi:sugar lactone lactonase YvrE
MDRHHRRGPWFAAVMAVMLVAGCSTGSGPAAVSPGAASAIPSTISPAPTATRTVLPSPTVPAAPTSSPLPALALLWEKSGPRQPTTCCQTWWPAIDPATGDIWVADSFANVFWIFKPDGTFVDAWGTPGSGPGQLDLATHRSGEPQSAGGIAFAPDGTFYVADTGNHRVEKFGASRRFVDAWGSFGSADGQFAEPFGIVTDGKTVYVSDDDRGDIQAFDPNGRFLRTFGPVETNAGIFMAIDANGTLYRAAGEDRPSSLLRYAPSGSVAATIDTGVSNGFVAGLAIGPKGTLFVNIGHKSAAGHQLVELDATGRQIGLWSTGGETGVVDPAGTAIYLASDGNPVWPTASLRKYALP